MTADMYLTQLKILYVEDDDDTRENLKQYLRKKAGKVVTAADGAEGLRKYEEDKHNVSLIEHIHTSYYKVVRPELEYKIKEIIGM